MKSVMIPTREQCLALMDEFEMPAHIKQHSLIVSAIAVFLANHLKRIGLKINIELVQASALLHDIAKMRCIQTGESHSEIGGEMLEELGYFLLSPIVKEHVTMDVERVKGPITESQLVNYADKRVKHDQIVSIEERFQDLMERYTMTEEQRTRMTKRLKLYQMLERKVFEHLPVKPTGQEIVGLSQIDY